MWSFLLDHAKLAVCDGFSRKAADSKNAPQWKHDERKDAKKKTIRFDGSSPTPDPKQNHFSLLDYAKLAACDGFARKAPESNALAQSLQFDNCSLNDVLEQSSQTLKDFAEDIVRSVSANSFAEGVKSLGVTSWWEQDPANDCQNRRMRETILVSNKLMKLLSGAAKNRSAGEHWHAQTVLKTVEEACNVEIHLRPHLGGDGMQGLAITGTGHQRDKAKSMIVRLASSCRIDSLSTVMNAWDHLASPSHMHCAGQGFEGWTFEASSPRSEIVTKEVCDPRMEDLKSLRTQLTKRKEHIEWRKDRQDLDYLWIHTADYRIAH